MNHFNYRHNTLYAEDICVNTLATQFGTPLYIYSRATIERHWHAFNDGLVNIPHLICYAVKANSNLAVLNIMARLGSGFDIVSIGELERVLAAGGTPEKIVFSGVGKTSEEIIRALDCGILSFNVESEAELLRIESIACERKKIAPVSIRVNPDVDAKTHPYISTRLKENKFGVAPDVALKLLRHAAKSAHLKTQGIDCHIGSQITELSPFLEALDRVLALVDQLEEHGIAITHLNMGGGVGVIYHDETPIHPSEYGAALCERLKGRNLTLVLEPGRAIVANAGILVTKIEYLKVHHNKHFAIVDAAMNDLIRPAMYDAYHEIIPITQNEEGVCNEYDIVGPVCETGDFLAKNRLLCLHPQQLLAISTAGAYGFSMSSNYNSRPRAAEIMVDGTQTHLVRPREMVCTLYENEKMLP